MNDLFPSAGFMRRGYHRGQVEAFFTEARAAYERPMLDDQALSSLDVRRAAFDIKRGGYKCVAVDSALDRLEARIRFAGARPVRARLRPGSMDEPPGRERSGALSPDCAVRAEIASAPPSVRRAATTPAR